MPFLLIRMATTRRFRRGLRERLTIYGEGKRRLASSSSIWIQAASVGEVTAAIPLIKLLRENHPEDRIVITCQTVSGRAVAREKIGDGIKVVLSPLDLGFFVNRFIRLTSPRILILIETEIWPGMIITARRGRIPIVIVNGRLSSSSFRNYRKVTFLVRPLLRMVSAFGMRSEEDARRVRRLGAPPGRVIMTGNIKFDSLIGPDFSPEVRKDLEARLGTETNGMLIVGGSTFEGEDRILYRVYRELFPRFPGLRLILAPRHLERVASIEAYLRSQRGSYFLFSSLPREGEGGVVILDVMGVLCNLYGLASVVFIGRSLRGYGGQNPIEPISMGRPVLFGPHMENFRKITGELVAAGGAIIIKDESELKKRLSELLSDPARRQRMGEKGRRVVESHRGATLRNLKLINDLLNFERS